LVLLEAVIGRDGSIQDLRIITGHALLAPAAEAAVRQWQYRPTMLNNEPVEVVTTISVTFSLN
jgi:protein TonB